MTISRYILLRMTNVSNESCRINQNTHFITNNFFFLLPKIVPFMTKCRKNVLESETLQMAIWRRVACWISMATRAQAHARTLAPTHILVRTTTHSPTRAHVHTH